MIETLEDRRLMSAAADPVPLAEVSLTAGKVPSLSQPALSAGPSSGQVAMESLTIAHEGIERR